MCPDVVRVTILPVWHLGGHADVTVLVRHPGSVLNRNSDPANLQLLPSTERRESSRVTDEPFPGEHCMQGCFAVVFSSLNHGCFGENCFKTRKGGKLPSILYVEYLYCTYIAMLKYAVCVLSRFKCYFSEKFSISHCGSACGSAWFKNNL